MSMYYLRIYCIFFPAARIHTSGRENSTGPPWHSSFPVGNLHIYSCEEHDLCPTFFNTVLHEDLLEVPMSEDFIERKTEV